MNQDLETGELSIEEIFPVFPQLYVTEEHRGQMTIISQPCSGSTTPWGTFMSSLEYNYDMKYLRTDGMDSTYVCENWAVGDLYWKDTYPYFPEVLNTYGRSTVYRYFNEVCDPSMSTEDMVADFLRLYGANWYYSGLQLETIIHGDGNFEIIPHFSMGRMSSERTL
eukprot:UN32460